MQKKHTNYLLLKVTNQISCLISTCSFLEFYSITPEMSCSNTLCALFSKVALHYCALFTSFHISVWSLLWIKKLLHILPSSLVFLADSGFNTSGTSIQQWKSKEIQNPLSFYYQGNNSESIKGKESWKPGSQHLQKDMSKAPYFSHLPLATIYSISGI